MMFSTTPLPTISSEAVEVKPYEAVILGLMGGFAVTGVLLASSGHYITGPAMFVAAPALGLVTGLVVIKTFGMKGPSWVL